MADAEHTTLVIEGSDHGGYVVKGYSVIGDRFGGLMFAGSLDECFAFIRRSIRKVDAPKDDRDLEAFKNKVRVHANGLYGAYKA